MAAIPSVRNDPPHADPPHPRDDDQRLARRVARAAASFEHRLLGRAPTSATVIAAAGWMAVSIIESLSPIERRVADGPPGSWRVRDHHESLFDATRAALCEHVRQATGVVFTGGMAHVDTVSGTVIKTLATRADIELFLLGEGLPGLGVPVDAHLHAHGAGGNGSARQTSFPEGPSFHEEGAPCSC
jgi:uncharacterized protein YbcI